MFPLKIVTYEGVIFDSVVTKVTIPAKKGLMTVLRGHEPLITTLKKGFITIYHNKVEQINISGGTVSIEASNKCIVITKRAEI